MTRRLLLSALAAIWVAGSGLTVRAIGLRHGEPRWIYHPDVSKQVVVARRTYEGIADPSRSFPNDVGRRLYPYGTAAIAGTLARGQTDLGLGPDLSGLPNDPEDRWRWAVRLRKLAVGTLLVAVAAVTFVRSIEAGVAVGLLSGLLVALEPMNARYSHYGMNDVPLVAMLLLSWMASARISHDSVRSIAPSLVAGLATGLGFGIKYQAVLGLVFPATTWWVLRHHGRGAILRSAFVFSSGLTLGALATTPLLRHAPLDFFTSLPEFLSWQSAVIGGGAGWPERIQTNLAWLAVFASSSSLGALLLGAPLVVARACSAGTDDIERRRLASALLFSTALLLVLVCGRELMRSNDLLPVIAMLGVSLPASLPRRRGRVVGWVVAVGITVGFGATAMIDARALARVDTRERALDWCRDQLPRGTTVLYDRYAIPTGRSDLDEQKVQSFSDSEVRPRVEKGEIDVLVTTSLTSDRYVERWSPWFDPEAAGLYRRLSERYRIAAVFRDRKLEFAHPDVTVYVRR